jgi:predicted transposase/invertase (TIGR01784 family)
LNPDVERDLATEKGSVLDVRVTCDGGAQIDLEMQANVYSGFRQRILYYWARCYAGQLLQGDEHADLRPVISIVWLRENLFDAPRFHSVVRACEEHDHAVFCQDFELHVLELRKLGVAQAPSQLERWGRFFRFESEDAIEQLSREDSIMEEAKQTLEHLSADPKVVSLARERDLARMTHGIYMAAARKEGLAEGEAIGEARGVAIGEARGVAIGEARGVAIGEARGVAIGEARGTIETLCEVYGIELTAERRTRLGAMSLAELQEQVARIKRERCW